MSGGYGLNRESLDTLGPWRAHLDHLQVSFRAWGHSALGEPFHLRITLPHSLFTEARAQVRPHEATLVFNLPYRGIKFQKMLNGKQRKSFIDGDIALSLTAWQGWLRGLPLPWADFDGQLNFDGPAKLYLPYEGLEVLYETRETDYSLSRFVRRLYLLAAGEIWEVHVNGDEDGFLWYSLGSTASAISRMSQRPNSSLEAFFELFAFTDGDEGRKRALEDFSALLREQLVLVGDEMQITPEIKL